MEPPKDPSKEPSKDPPIDPPKDPPKGVGPSALEPFVLAFFPQYKSSEAEGNFKVWYILY